MLNENGLYLPYLQIAKLRAARPMGLRAASAAPWLALGLADQGLQGL